MVSRGVEKREAGKDRVCASLRALDVQRKRARSGTLHRRDGRDWRHRFEWHHQFRPDELFRERPDFGGRLHAMDGVRPDGAPAGSARPAETRFAARRGAERKAAGRKPALWGDGSTDHAKYLPGGASLFVDDNRRHG